MTVKGRGNLARTGYDFAGWNTNSDGTPYRAGDTFSMPAANTTLYARWIRNNGTITLNPDAGDGAFSQSKDIGFTVEN